MHAGDAIKTPVVAQRKSSGKHTYETEICICLATRARKEAGPARRPHQPRHRRCFRRTGSSQVLRQHPRQRYHEESRRRPRNFLCPLHFERRSAALTVQPHRGADAGHPARCFMPSRCDTSLRAYSKRASAVHGVDQRSGGRQRSSRLARMFRTARARSAQPAGRRYLWAPSSSRSTPGYACAFRCLLSSRCSRILARARRRRISSRDSGLLQQDCRQRFVRSEGRSILTAGILEQTLI